MEKELKFPLHLQLFADTGNGEDEDDILDDEDFDDDEANGGDDEEVEEETDSEDQHDDEVETKTDSKKKKKGQSQEENARQAKLRREKEQREREKIRKEAYEQGKRDGELGSTKVNPYTNKPIEDEYDLRIYKLQKEIADSGGDPVNDLPMALAKLEREQAAKVKKEAEAKTAEERKAQEDVKDFMEKYPKVDTQALLKDPTFLEYAEGKLGGKQTLAQIYSAYRKFKKSLGVVDEDEQIEKEARSKSTSPSSSTRKQGRPKSFLEMTDDEYLAHEKENNGDYF